MYLPKRNESISVYKTSMSVHVRFQYPKSGRHLNVCTCGLSGSVVSDSLQPWGLQSPRLLCPWESPGKNTDVGCHFLIQGIFLTQGSKCPPTDEWINFAIQP